MSDEREPLRRDMVSSAMRGTVASFMLARPIVAHPALETRAARLIRDYLDRHFEMSACVAALSDNGTQFHVAGGAVRSAILSPSSYGDLDLVVRGDQTTTADFFLGLGLEKTTTRYGDARFYWNRLPIDLIAVPATTTYDVGLVQVLRTFDLGCNAIGFDPRSQTIVDPLDSLANLMQGMIRINRSAWEGARATTLANQCVRLAKLLHETPRACLARADVEFLAETIVPQLKTVIWDELTPRFPLGRDCFLDLFRARLAAERQKHGVTGELDQ